MEMVALARGVALLGAMVVAINQLDKSAMTSPID